MPYNCKCRFINRGNMIHSESPIDEMYRLKLFEYYLKDPLSGLTATGNPKWQFICPFCGTISSKEYKKKHRRAALLWNTTQNSWLFNCKKCLPTTSMYRYLEKVNPAMARSYQRERSHSGTTGWGHDCPLQERLVGVSTGSYGSIRSRSAPDSFTSL